MNWEHLTHFERLLLATFNLDSMVICTISSGKQLDLFPDNDSFTSTNTNTSALKCELRTIHSLSEASLLYTFNLTAWTSVLSHLVNSWSCSPLDPGRWGTGEIGSAPRSAPPCIELTQRRYKYNIEVHYWGKNTVLSTLRGLLFSDILSGEKIST